MQTPANLRKRPTSAKRPQKGAKHAQITRKCAKRLKRLKNQTSMKNRSWKLQVPCMITNTFQMLFSPVATANQSNDTQWRAGDVWGCHVQGNARGRLSSFHILSHPFTHTDNYVYTYTWRVLDVYTCFASCAPEFMNCESRQMWHMQMHADYLWWSNLHTTSSVLCLDVFSCFFFYSSKTS